MEILRWMYNGIRMGFTLGIMAVTGGATFLFFSSLLAGIVNGLSGKKAKEKNDRVKSEN